jgi:hypothetical protein
MNIPAEIHPEYGLMEPPQLQRDSSAYSTRSQRLTMNEFDDAVI